MKQLRHRLGRENFLSISVSYVPIINGEEKTKPTQHAIRQVRSAGLIPDVVRISSLKPRTYLTI
jgi:CTP synthase